MDWDRATDAKAAKEIQTFATFARFARHRHRQPRQCEIGAMVCFAAATERGALLRMETKVGFRAEQCSALQTMPLLKLESGCEFFRKLLASHHARRP
jgi:hypothetical protein